MTIKDQSLYISLVIVYCNNCEIRQYMHFSVNGNAMTFAPMWAWLWHRTELSSAQITGRQRQNLPTTPRARVGLNALS